MDTYDVLLKVNDKYSDEYDEWEVTDNTGRDVAVVGVVGDIVSLPILSTDVASTPEAMRAIVESWSVEYQGTPVDGFTAIVEPVENTPGLDAPYVR